MEKFVNYVRNGKGIGLLFILAASLIVTIIMLLVAKSFYGEMRPQAMLIANDFLPLTVKGGKIVDPADAYKRVDLKFGNTGTEKDNFAVVLDTREPTPSLPKGAQGLYIYKDVIYVASANQIRNYDLQDGLWDKDSFEKLLDSVTGIMSGVIGVVLIGILFVVCLFKTFMAAVFGFIAAKVFGRAKWFDMPSLMRFCAVFISALEILRWGALPGISFSGFQTFWGVVLLEIFYILREKPEEV